MSSSTMKRQRESSEVSEEDILEEIENDLLKEDTVTIQIEALNTKISGTYGLERRMEELDAQLSDLTNDFVDIRAENYQLKHEVTMLKSILIKKDKEIQEHEK